MFCCCRVLSPHTVVVEIHLHVGGKYFCIQLCRVFMRGDYDVFVASGATASEMNLIPHVLESV